MQYSARVLENIPLALVSCTDDWKRPSEAMKSSPVERVSIHSTEGNSSISCTSGSRASEWDTKIIVTFSAPVVDGRHLAMVKEGGGRVCGLLLEVVSRVVSVGGAFL